MAVLGTKLIRQYLFTHLRPIAPKHTGIGLYVTVFFLLLTASAGICQEKVCSDLPTQAMVQRLVQTPSPENSTEATLDAIIERLNAFEKQNKGCMEAIEAELNKLNASLEAIGTASDTDTPEIAKQRKNLLKQKGQLENQMAESKLLALAIQDGLSDLSKKRAHLASQQLFYREKGLFSLFLAGSTDTPSTKDAVLNFLSALKAYFHELLLQKNGLSDLNLWELLGLFFMWAMGLWLGIYIKRTVGAFSQQQNMLGVFLKYMNASYGRYAPGVVSLGLLAIALGFVRHSFLPDTLVSLFAYALLFYVFQLATLALLLELDILPLDSRQKTYLLRRWAIVLACVLPFLLISQASIFQESPWPVKETARILGFFLTIIGLFWVLNAIKLNKSALKLLRACEVSLLFLLAINFIGYHNLAEYLLTGLLLTAFFVVLALWLTRMLTSAFRPLSYAGETGRFFKERLGIRPGKPFYAVLWLQISLQLFIWAVSCLLILTAWDIKGTFSTHIQGYLVKGVQVGELTFSPLKAFVGFLIFLILWICARMLKYTIKQRYKHDTTMDPGAVDALVTISGYVGFILAVLIGALIAGINLSNLAIIAGALSVGIGFGLQNIINNFVSGLILLFEQPIKKGDWIVIGGTEGFVKRISVRSTVIQSFDNADIIVPNSDLISKEVINWTHDDRSGRLRIPVGVAYGSDLELVRSILLEVAMSHPKVLKDEKHPKPKVLFRNFGDSSLDFLLVCYIQNITERFDVETDLRTRIDDEFRRAGVSIPFPQRDIHIISKN
jgi:small-conductance mechanosensitive channel